MEFAGIFGMLAVMIQGAVEFALQHSELLSGRLAAQNGFVELAEPFFWLCGQQTLRERLRGFFDRLVIEQRQGLQWRVRAIHAHLAHATLCAVKEEGRSAAATPEGI